VSIKFEGINIYSKDAHKSFEFYKGLGFDVKKVDDDTVDEWWCGELLINGSTLWIWKDHSGIDAEKSERVAMQFVVKCEDIQKSYEEFKAKGYDVSQPKKMFYGGWEMKLTDIDGNRILFLD